MVANAAGLTADIGFSRTNPPSPCAAEVPDRTNRASPAQALPAQGSGTSNVVTDCDPERRSLIVILSPFPGVSDVTDEELAVVDTFPYVVSRTSLM